MQPLQAWQGLLPGEGERSRESVVPLADAIGTGRDSSIDGLALWANEHLPEEGRPQSAAGLDAVLDKVVHLGEGRVALSAPCRVCVCVQFPSKLHHIRQLVNQCNVLLVA